MRRDAPVALDLSPLLTALPMVVLALGQLGVRVVRSENRMIRETAEAIVWGPPRRCCCQKWRIARVLPCYGCGCHG
ncbi:MAG: hypothetical protein ACREFP_12455 [Acetobacteraceae bacterium]